jgi:predicted phage terminase large subunit-like protein
MAKPKKETTPQRAAELAENRRLRKLLVEKDRRELAANFHEFFKAAWDESIEPHTPFNDSWHYEYLCEWGQLIGSGQFKKLYPDKKGVMILIPPRTLKSNIFSVALNAWCWTHSPWKKFLCLSYGQDLATPLSQKTRNLVQSPWYQKRWKLELREDANEKHKFDTTEGGYRFSSGTVATGWGGNVIVCDDMLNAKYAYSKARRTAVNGFWDDALTTRRNNPATDVYLLVMQRLFATDLAGHLLAKEAEEWVKVEIPMEAEETKDYVFPISGKVHTRVKGDILVPTMNDRRYIAGEKKNPRKWTAQFQQDPSPPGGFIFDPDKWKLYKVKGRPDPEFQLMSVDTATKGKLENDKAAIQVWGVSGPDRWLLKRVHEHLGFTELCDRIEQVKREFPKVSYILVEAQSIGPGVVKVLGEKFPGFVLVTPKDDKYSRAMAASAAQASGNVYIPDPEDDVEMQAEWIDVFSQFQGDGSVEFDDEVDAYSQAMIWLADRFFGDPHLDRLYEETMKGKNTDPQTGEECPGCHRKGTVVREGTSWICKGCGSSGRGGKRRVTQTGM